MKKSDLIALALLPLPFTTLGIKLFTFGGQYVPEIFIICWTAFALTANANYFYVAKKLLLSKLFFAALAIVFSISVFSIFRPDFNPISFYGRFRALLLFAIGFMAVLVSTRKGWERQLKDCLLVICSSACVMYVIAAALISSGENEKASISMLCFAITAYLLVERRIFAPALIIVTLGVIGAYFSFYRQNYIIALQLVLTTTLLVTGKSIHITPRAIRINSHIFPIIAIPIVTTIGIQHFWNEIIGFLTSSEAKYIQSIGKTLDLLDFLRTGAVDDSGSSRLDNYAFFVEHFPVFFLPNGLVDDSSLSLYSIWGGPVYSPGVSVVRDSLVAYFVTTFGFGLFLIAAISYTFLTFISAKSNLRHFLEKATYLGPGIILVFFVDGATLTQIQKSLFFGVALALLISQSQSRRQKKLTIEQSYLPLKNSRQHAKQPLEQ